MTTEQDKAVISEEEISLKDLILKFWEYFNHLLKQWKIISLFVLAGLAFYLISHITHVPKYTAAISFMINEDESSSLGGIGNLLGSFGGLLGGTSEYNLDKVLEISRSDRVGEKLLLKKAVVNGREDYIANHLIITQDTLDEWLKVNWYKKPFTNMERKKRQRAHRFTADSINYSDPVETYVLKKLYKHLFGSKETGTGGIVGSDYDELTGIMTVQTTDYDDSLAISTTNLIFEELSTFYVEKSIGKQQQTYDLMKMKHDSINDLLSQKRYALARFQDTNRGLFKISDQVKKDQYQTDVLIFSQALGEAKKNLEISDFALRNKTPFITVLDRPFLPISSSKGSIFRALLLGAIIGGVLGSLFVLARKLYSDIMS